MEKGEYKIVWDSARVNENLLLTVPVMGDGTGIWHEVFVELAEQQNRQLAAKKWGSINKAGTVGPIHVEKVTAGCEAELKTHLDDLAAKASQRAVELEQRKQEDWEVRQAEGQKRADEAATVERGFRDA
jgi:hypothetical protein